MHFRVRVGVSNCEQVLTKISFVIFDIVVKEQVLTKISFVIFDIVVKKQVLTKISFVIFDIVVKKQIKCGLAWSVLLSTTIRVVTAAKICSETVLRELNSCFDLVMHVNISKLFTGI